MEMMKRIIFIISLILLALSSCKKDKAFISEIYDEPGYAIGTVMSTASVNFGIQFNYSYYVGSTKYTGNKKEAGINQDGKYVIGRQFLVVYKLSEPAKSDINFKYRIDSEQDFLDLLEKFKNNPPKP